jgi:hypothetical protein
MSSKWAALRCGRDTRQRTGAAAVSDPTIFAVAEAHLVAVHLKACPGTVTLGLHRVRRHLGPIQITGTWSI